jgi:hypothetical protein
MEFRSLNWKEILAQGVPSLKEDVLRFRLVQKSQKFIV